MLDIQKKAIAKLMGVLDGVGARYKIILPDGEEYGELECKPVKDKKCRGGIYARGETAEHYRPFFDAASPVAVGGVVRIPFDRFEPAVLAGNVYSYAHALWGKGNSYGSRNDAEGVVEVMRVG
jgi:hypothetical protein